MKWEAREDDDGVLDKFSLELRECDNDLDPRLKEEASEDDDGVLDKISLELSQKGSDGGRGVKEKSLNRNSINTSSCISVSTKLDDTMNEDTPGGVASTVKEGVTPFVVDMMVEKEKISILEDVYESV
nr:hypothetical protein [Tanacetum cinerariifolium]